MDFETSQLPNDAFIHARDRMYDASGQSQGTFDGLVVPKAGETNISNSEKSR